jgi:hypothetical protein
MIWLGDFNRHHPLWELEANRCLNSPEQAIDPLLDLLHNFDMDLVLPPGIPTLETVTGNWTRPDNVWLTHSNTSSIITCNVNTHLRPPNTDHLPIITIISLPIARSSSPPSPDFHDVDWIDFDATLSTLLDLHSPALHINNKTEYDTKVSKLTSLLQQTIATTVPIRKPTPFSKRWWCPELNNLKKKKNKLSNEAYKY